jgi:ligand-binding sensor domain-containing protein
MIGTLFKAVLFNICWLALITAHSQQPLRFDRLGREDGLSQSSVNCMLRDKDGFMWFGTQDGLNLYDGKKFRVFQNQPGDSCSLSNNYIVSICEDEEGYLWIGTMTGGLNRFDKKTERFRIFLHSDSLNSISENTVWTVLPDGKGNIWAGTSYGLNRYDKESGLFTSYRPDPADPESLATDLTVSLYLDKQGRVWVGTVEGLCLFNADKENFTRCINPAGPDPKGANIIWSISEMPSGEIITGTDNGIYLLDVNTLKYRRIQGSPAEAQLVAWSVNAKQPGTIWAGTDKGLFRISIPGFTAETFLHDPVNIYSIADNNIWCLLPDPAGFLWAGTNNGICKTKTSPAHFRLLTSHSGQAPVLSSSRVMSVLEDRLGYLWIGTHEGGLNCISPDGKTVTIYNSVNSGLRNDNVWALAEDSENNIYIGNYQGGLHIFNRVTGIIRPFAIDEENPFSLSNRRVLALLAARDGTIWIATRGGGLNRLDPETGKFKVYQNGKDDDSGFPANTVLSLAMDPEGRIWAGTQEGGLALYLPQSDQFRVFTNKPGDETSLSDNNIWAIEFDNQGRLWAGTQGGINVSADPGENMKFRYFTTRDGLKSNTILGIKEDSEGNIWMSTFCGIAKLNIKTFELEGNTGNQDEFFALFHPLIILFDTDHGLQGLEFNQGASHKGYSGTLYFGGNNGLNYFSDKEVNPSGFEPPVVITGMKIFNREVAVLPFDDNDHRSGEIIQHRGSGYSMLEKITYLDELTLTYRESVISFEFSSLDYSNPDKNQYTYKMIGFDENWNFMGTQNTATYTNLDPGEYSLIIRGSNSDGIWNTKEKALRITIIPPFWKTGWFITLSAIFIIVVISLALRRAFINQQRKSQREKELIELQLRTIKSQIDPHFAFNAINTIASFIFSDKPDLTYDYFTRFARMIRNILEDNEKISRRLAEELEFVRNYLDLQKMRFREKFEYTISVDDEVPGNTQVPKMIIQSYAENSIKHGIMHLKTGGLLQISIRKDNEILKLIIEDNGIGREKAAMLNPGTTHRGFRIMERTIELYSKLYHTRIIQEIEDLKDLDGRAAGTRVILTLYPPVDTKAGSGSKFNMLKILKRHDK